MYQLMSKYAKKKRVVLLLLIFPSFWISKNKFGEALFAGTKNSSGRNSTYYSLNSEKRVTLKM